MKIERIEELCEDMCREIEHGVSEGECEEWYGCNEESVRKVIEDFVLFVKCVYLDEDLKKGESNEVK